MWSCYGNFTCNQKPDEDSICGKFCKGNKSNSTWKTLFFNYFYIQVCTVPINTNFDAIPVDKGDLGIFDCSKVVLGICI